MTGGLQMREVVKEKLLQEYIALKYKSQSTCLKYYYQYNGVNVNLFFDAYEEEALTFNMILIYDKNYYFTPLNIKNSKIRKEYLTQIPLQICHQILVDNQLDDFFHGIEEYILSNSPFPIYYSGDKIFVNTLKYSKQNVDLPFWHFLRHTRMKDKTLEELSERADISRKALKKIQAANMTLVRTSDPLKRKKLTIILGDEGIELD